MHFIRLVLSLLLIASPHLVRAASGPPSPEGIRIQPGYFMEAAVTGLDFPTAVAAYDSLIWIAEAGSIPGFAPKVKQVSFDGSATTILSPGDLPAGKLLGPLTDVTYDDGWLWITHRQMGTNGWSVGAISKFQPGDPSGTFETVVTDLPSAGDHLTDEIVFDTTGTAYFSQGSATNSSVVGPDNWLITGWLPSFSDFHDFPPVDIVLNGQDYLPPVPFPLDPDGDDVTGPFMPYGSGPISAGTLVPGASPDSPQQGIIAGNGAVYSFDPAAESPASTLRLEAWGLRNPYGIGLDPMRPGVLFVTNNGADSRGFTGETQVPIDEENIRIVEPRPIENDFDDLYEVELGGNEEFFGWPDYFHDPDSGEVLPVTDDLFCAGLETCPEFVLDQQFRESLEVLPAVAQLGNHTSANKFDFSTSKDFKFVGDIFVAYTGSFVPITGATEFRGYKVVRVDLNSGQVSDFIANTGDTVEEIFEPNSFNKPIDIKFSGDLMMVVDFGVFEPGLDVMLPGTGKLWLVSHGRDNLVRTFGE